MNLIQYKYFASPFVKLIGERKDSSSRKVEIIQVHIETVARISELLTDVIKQKSRLPNSTESLDSNDPLAPVDLTVQSPDDGCIDGADQKLMCFEKMLHLENE